MEFKEKVLNNARKFARKFSIRNSSRKDKFGSDFDDKENTCRLTRSQSGELNNT